MIIYPHEPHPCEVSPPIFAEARRLKLVSVGAPEGDARYDGNAHLAQLRAARAVYQPAPLPPAAQTPRIKSGASSSPTQGRQRNIAATLLHLAIYVGSPIVVAACIEIAVRAF